MCHETRSKYGLLLIRFFINQEAPVGIEPTAGLEQTPWFTYYSVNFQPVMTLTVPFPNFFLPHLQSVPHFPLSTKS
jgi:hypothetical protein